MSTQHTYCLAVLQHKCIPFYSILCLDSLNNYHGHSVIVNNLQKWLNYEWHRTSNKTDFFTPNPLTKQHMALAKPTGNITFDIFLPAFHVSLFSNITLSTSPISRQYC
jgi:hypothetical protein